MFNAKIKYILPVTIIPIYHDCRLLLEMILPLHQIPLEDLKLDKQTIADNFWCHLLFSTVYKVREKFDDQALQQRYTLILPNHVIVYLLMLFFTCRHLVNDFFVSL